MRGKTGFGLIMAAALLLTLGASTASAERIARVVYVESGQLISIKADGSGRMLLTKHRQGHHSFPVFAPGSRQLFFVRDSNKLLSMPASGGKSRVIYRAGKGRQIMTPSFDRRGRLFVLDRQNPWRRGPGLQKVVSMNQDGSAREVVFKRMPGRNGYRESLSRVDVDPSGSRLVMSSDSFRASDGPLELFHIVKRDLKTIWRAGTGGDWSPDGRRILFGSQHAGLHGFCNNSEICWSDTQLYTVRPDGSGLRTISRASETGSEVSAQFSPDGSQIIFSGDRNNYFVEEGQYGPYPSYMFGGNEIYSMRSNGSCETWLTNGNVSSGMPTFSSGSNLDFASGHCGPSNRKPVVRGRPGPWLNSDDSASLLNRYWLGPIHRGVMFGRDGIWSGRSMIDYDDCSHYRATHCGGGFTVHSDRICADNDGGSHGDRTMLWDGTYEGLTPFRGAAIVEAGDRSSGGPFFLVTDRQLISFEWFKVITESMEYADFLRFAGAIRSVASTDNAGPLPPPTFRKSLVDRARSIAAAVAESESVASIASRMKMKERAVRAFAEFGADLASLPEYRVTACGI